MTRLKPTKKTDMLTKMKNYSKKTDETMDTFSADNQRYSRNTTIAKMKRRRQTQANQRKNHEYGKEILDIDENVKTEATNPRGAHGDQNQGQAVITGFHSETSESEVVHLLKR